jgi:prophage regulatory protein
MARTGLKKATLYALCAENQFPKQIALTGVRAVAWIESEVCDWIQARIAKARQ